MAELRHNPGLAPSLFWFETRHLFVTAERRGRMKPGEAALSMAQLRLFPISDAGVTLRLIVRRHSEYLQ